MQVLVIYEYFIETKGKMLKKEVILWISGIVIALLVGYLNAVKSEDYPVSGTVGIEGRKVSYLFPKYHYGDDSLLIRVRADLTHIDGELLWKRKGSNEEFKRIKMLKEGGFLVGKIMPLPPKTVIEYCVKLYSEGRINELTLPEGGAVTVGFKNKIPKSLSTTAFLTLYGGLLLALRAGLEIFNVRKRIKMFSIFTFISFLLNKIVLSPVIISINENAIGVKVLPPSVLFPPLNLVLPLVWLLSLILIFITRYGREAVLSATVITLLFTIIF